MIKKYVAIMLSCVSILAFTTACGTHTHEVGDDWELDKEKHWKICKECEEKTEKGEHQFQEDGLCETCGAFVADNGEDGYSIITYDSHGSMDRCTDYDTDGNVISENTYECEYYEDGNPKYAKDYCDGVLQREAEYLPCENQDIAEVYESKSISYEADGSKAVSTYNEYSMLLSYTQYDADGNVIGEDIYDYVYDEDGNMRKQTCHTDGVLSMEATYELDTDGNPYTSYEAYYEADGTIISETRYDAEGNMLE